MAYTVGVQLSGMADLQSALAKIAHPAQNRLVQKALTRGAVITRKFVRAEAPVGRGRGGNGRTMPGALKGSVGYRQARTKPGAWVRLDKKKTGAFYAHMVVGGTKPHQIRTHAQVAANVRRKGGGAIGHPGTAPIPFVETGFRRGEAEITAEIFRVISEGLGL